MSRYSHQLCNDRLCVSKPVHPYERVFLLENISRICRANISTATYLEAMAEHRIIVCEVVLRIMPELELSSVFNQLSLYPICDKHWCT